MKALLKIAVLLAFAPAAFAQEEENITERQPPVVTMEKVQENEKVAQQERIKDQQERRAALEQNKEGKAIPENTTITKNASKKPEGQ